MIPASTEKNKLVIIGNGFDLAHGLKTSYGHFIEHLLLKIATSESQHSFFSRTFEDPYAVPKMLAQDQNFRTSSNLFKALLRQYSDSKESRWVDIEAVYFSLLIECFTTLNSVSSVPKSNTRSKIQDLNSDLEIIKYELYEYLSPINKGIQKNMARYDHLFISLFNNTIQAKPEFGQAKTLYLNFNYTDTLFLYNYHIKKSHHEIINIHGNLLDQLNPIVFGYGDEMNPHHQGIVDMNDNILFTHFKSFKYALNESYSSLLLFLQQPFEVYILGHSCGLSDRVLFSTIFNSETCEYVYPFYYERPDGTDDFTEKTYELSRHFKQAETFRRKVRPKTKCQKM